jgi:hypothetical protein
MLSLLLTFKKIKIKQSSARADLLLVDQVLARLYIVIDNPVWFFFFIYKK